MHELYTNTEYYNNCHIEPKLYFMVPSILSLILVSFFFFYDSSMCLYQNTMVELSTLLKLLLIKQKLT